MSEKAAAELRQIRDRLLEDAARDLALADAYGTSRRQGERSSAPIIARRGQVTIAALELIETELSVV